MRSRLTILSSALLAASVAPLAAQGVEIAPFAGWRAGGAVFTTLSGARVEHDTATLGAIVDVPLEDGMQVEAAFSHQHADGVTTDHWQIGGLQEFLPGRVRPFLTGTAGLTRYAVGGSNEVRFLLGAGGGVKIFPAAHFGLRLDGRVFATFLDADGTAIVCGAGPCFVHLHVDVAWQAEFTAGVIVRFH